MENKIRNIVYSLFRNHDLSTELHAKAIDTITELCLTKIAVHPELAASLVDESAKQYFVMQVLLENWQRCISLAIFPPKGVEKGKKLYEAFHESIIEHEVKDIVPVIETTNGEYILAEAVGEHFFVSTREAQAAIDAANAEIEACIENG